MEWFQLCQVKNGMNPESENNFAARLKILLDILGLRQKNFAEKLGIDPSHVGKLKKGQSPSPLLVTAISCVFKIERRWLETGEGEIFSAPEAVHSEAAANELVKAYKEDLGRAHKRIEKLALENARLRGEAAKGKLAEVEREVEKSKRRKKEYQYPEVADKGRRVEETE